MGIYINPPLQDKKEWLRENARPVRSSDLLNFDFSGDSLPVCVVDNGAFMAAGVAYDAGELKVFMREDGRAKEWHVVKRQALRHVIPVSYFKMAGVVQ